MSTLDILLLVFIGLGAIKGYSRGFIVEVLTFLAFFIGLFLALELTVPVSTILFEDSDWTQLASIFVFIALFLLLSIAIKAGAKALKGVVDMTLFGGLDNVLGAVAGMFKWAFVLSIVFWLFDSVGFDLRAQYGEDALLFPFISKLGPTVFSWLGDMLPFIEDLIESMENMPKKNTFITYASGFNPHSS